MSLTQLVLIVSALMFSFTAINLLFLRPLSAPGRVPNTAVCIPLRNEERNVRKLINNLKLALPDGVRVYLYEDRSEDATYQLLAEETKNDDRFEIIRGLPLPDGWSGKVHACHQLARHTTEPYLLFLDADVTIAPTFIARMHATMRREKVVFLSGFPRFPSKPILGKLLIPMQHVLIAQHLPLMWRKVKHPAFAAANGMNVLVERDSYENVGGHEAIRDSLVDDIDLCRLFKRRKLATSLVQVAPYITCDMYETNRDVWEGFSKNVFKGMNDSKWVAAYLVSYYTVQLSAFLLCLIEPDWFSLAAAGLVIFGRLLIDIKARSPYTYLHPFGITIYIVLLLTAIVQHMRGRPVRWKGRLYS